MITETPTLDQLPPPGQPLDQRIAAALEGDVSVLTSGELADLLDEVEAAHEVALDAADEARRRSLDPGNLDPESARSEMQALEFVAERLRGAYPRLADRRDRTALRERATVWEQQYRHVEAKRDELVLEFRENYSRLAGQLADLFGRMAELATEIAATNSAAPYGEQRRLLAVEPAALGTNRNLPITQAVQLPDFADASRMIWPPPQPSLAAICSMSMPVLDHPGDEWWREVEAREAERLRDSARVARFYSEQQKVREELEEAEAERRTAQRSS